MSEPADLDRKLIAAVERLGRALRVARQAIATRHQLTVLQLQILEVLHETDGRQVGQIAAELDVTQPTISDAVRALVDKGVVSRAKVRDDGRVTLVSLTPAGARLAAEVGAELAPLLGADRTTSEEARAETLGVLLDEILRLQRLGVITINRSCLGCQHYQPPAKRGSAECLLLEISLQPADLRVDCPDHLIRQPL